MSLDDIGLFRVMNERVNWLQQRQGVLSQNVSNSDTPGAQAHDLEAFSFRDALRGSGGANAGSASKTHASHLSAGAGSGDARVEEQPLKTLYESAPDGNGIVLEEQMLKASQNTMEYQALMSLYRQQFNLLMSAAR